MAISNIYFLLPDVANILFWSLNSYPEVVLISSATLSLVLNDTKSLASLLFALGDCKTGLVWTKQVNPLSLIKTNVSQSLNFPIFFSSSAETKVEEKIVIVKKKYNWFNN